jgi:3-keto-5-aminohexanoate cleavage enzyme
MNKLMIEAAINESILKEEHPGVPYGPEEVADQAIACARAGAAIIHFHARDRRSGENLWTSYETYAEAYLLIQKETDAILCPTYTATRYPKEEAVGHIVKLARDPSVTAEWITWDIGSVNSGSYDPATHRFSRLDRVLSLTHEHLLYFLETCREIGVHYSLGIREPGHIRHLLAYLDMGAVKPPVTLKLFFSENDPYGFPPSVKGLLSYLDLIPPTLECHWFVTTYGAEHSRMNMLAAAMGGHIRTGVGDNPLLDGKLLSNVEQVERAVELGLRAGRGVATPAEARQMLGISR